MTEWALAVFVVFQVVLFLLDLWETRRQDRLQTESDRVRWSTVGFLVLVLCLYLVIQVGGGRLLPSPDAWVNGVRRTSQAWGALSTESARSILVWGPLGTVLFYIAGFWDYSVHRFFSHCRWFWITHEYHHLPRQVTVWMPGIAARPFGFVPVALSTFATAVTMDVLLMVFRFPLWDLRPFLPVALLIITVLTISHSAFLRRHDVVHRGMRWLCLTTPQEHLLHHRIGSRCNYGNFTTLWDRLLGTYEDPRRVDDLESVPLGLPYDQDFLGTITLSRWRLSAKLRKRFQISQYCNIDDEAVD